MSLPRDIVVACNTQLESTAMPVTDITIDEPEGLIRIILRGTKLASSEYYREVDYMSDVFDACRGMMIAMPRFQEGGGLSEDRTYLSMTIDPKEISAPDAEKLKTLLKESYWKNLVLERINAQERSNERYGQEGAGGFRR